MFVSEVFPLHFFLLCIWMVYYLSWVSVVLVVIENLLDVPRSSAVRMKGT